MTRMERKIRRIQQIRRRVLLAAVFFTVAIVGIAAAVSEPHHCAKEKGEPVTGDVMADKPAVLLINDTTGSPFCTGIEETDGKDTAEDVCEAERTEQALLSEGYLNNEIPLSYDLQSYLRAVCAEYGVPYHIALGVIQAESSFAADVSNGICFGYMQIHKINSGWLGEKLGVSDLLDPYQNLRAGVYILGDLYADYGDWHKTLIAYNYGPAGAQEHVFSKGYTTTEYSRAVMGYADDWLEVTGA